MSWKEYNRAQGSALFISQKQQLSKAPPPDRWGTAGQPRSEPSSGHDTGGWRPPETEDFSFIFALFIMIVPEFEHQLSCIFSVLDQTVF